MTGQNNALSTPGPQPVTDTEAAAQTPPAWAVADGMLAATYRPGNMVRGLEMITAVVGAAEQAGHHPDIDLRYPTVVYRLVTHSVGGLTTFDVALARRIDEIAVALDIDPA